MDILIGFSRAKSPFAIGSKIIAASEARNYSHAFILYADAVSNKQVIFQASHGYVNIVSLVNFLEYNIISHTYKLSVGREKFKQFCIFRDENVGNKYSRKQIIWLFFAKLLQIKRWPSVIYNCIKNGPSEEICSELAERVLALLENPPVIEQLDQFTPSDLDSLLQEMKVPRGEIHQ